MSNELATVSTENTMSAIAFDVTSREGKKKLLNALNGAESLNDHPDKTQLTLVGLVVRPTTRVDDATGECVDCMGTTFITEDAAYFSMSDGIARSAQNLIAAYGESFAEEPVTIEFASRKLDAKRTLKFFNVL